MQHPLVPQMPMQLMPMLQKQTQVSSHDNMSRFLTQDDMDKIMVELRDHMTSQGKVLERQQQLMDHLLGRLETGLNASTSIPPSTEAGAITDLQSARNHATDRATPLFHPGLALNQSIPAENIASSDQRGCNNRTSGGRRPRSRSSNKYASTLWNISTY